MFNNPFGSAMGSDPGAFMRMLPMLFGQKQQGPQGMGGGMQSPQMPQQQPQQPADMFSGVKTVLDPNSNFMSSLMKSLGGGAGSPSMGGQRTGAPITNTPSTNMQNNPFMQMPWANGGMKQGQ